MRILVLAASVAAVVGMAAPASAANLLKNGGFEDRVVTSSDYCEAGLPYCVRSFASTPFWTQTGNGVDLIQDNYEQGGSGTPYWVLNNPSEGLNFLDMNQAVPGALGGIFQVVGATAGKTYDLSLDISAWARNSIPGTVGYDLYDPLSSLVLATGAFSESTENHTWDTRNLSAVATSGSIGVRIYGLAARQAGMGVDNVILTESGGVPEPASWALMILGMGLAGGVLRHRRGLALGAA